MRFVSGKNKEWTDEYLMWNDSVDKMYTPVENIWHPDVLILNTANDNLRHFVPTNAIVSKNGKVLWMIPHTASEYIRKFEFSKISKNFPKFDFLENFQSRFFFFFFFVATTCLIDA